jgi:hypothetical protein
MGGEPWFYFVDYQDDINAALQALRQREFNAGRYNPAEWFPKYPVNPNHAPGCKHSSIEEAMEDADADGTRSILDVESIALARNYGVAAPLDKDTLMDLYGTEKPTRKMIESTFDLFEDIDRGQAIYVIAYEQDQPSEIFFAGYSYD